MILAGDIGGTKTVLALFDETAADPRPVREATFPSQEHAAFEDVLSQFLSHEATPGVTAAAFGVAGPVIEGQVQTTNLPWFLDEADLARTLKARRVKLLNDLEAMAFGMLFLRPDELVSINPSGRRRKGHVAVIAAGTGLGEAMLCWDGERHHPIASEGGHASFAPQTEEQFALLKHLQLEHGSHVSWERVLSGPGFYDLYAFLRGRGGQPEPDWLTAEMKAGDPSAAVSRAGLAGKDPVCAATLEQFAYLYGAEAGNLALKCVAVGGVFVGGGIGPKLLPVLRGGAFLHGFTDKGRFADFLDGIDVNVALNPRTPLLGAARFAMRLV
jgi:glucokinase